MTPQLREAVRTALDHKALNLVVLNLDGICSFAEHFLICSGTSTRHTQAVSDAILEELKKTGISPAHVEGYAHAEWILMDYLGFVVHIFSERARNFYDLERLWKTAPKIPVLKEEG